MDGNLLAMSDEARQWLFYVLVGITLFYVVIRPWLRKKDPLEKKMPSFGLAKQREVERDMSNLLVELSEMARQVTAQLDTRAKKLELLIEEADRRLEELTRSARGEKEPVQNPAAVVEPVVRPGGRADELDSRYDEVYAMADEGLGMAEIASRLRRPSGEIELILALRVKG